MFDLTHPLEATPAHLPRNEQDYLYRKTTSVIQVSSLVIFTYCTIRYLKILKDNENFFGISETSDITSVCSLSASAGAESEYINLQNQTDRLVLSVLVSSCML